MSDFNNTYPRKQFERDSFFAIKDAWTLNDKAINLPYPKESPLSNYPNKEYENELLYKVNFTLPKHFFKESDNLILNIGAIDQICEVYLNNQKLGEHVGGYLPFSFQINNFVVDTNNELVIKVKDDLDTTYPYGKQSKTPKGMWYTPVSGIWQSIWLEAIPKKNSINSLKIDVTKEEIIIKVDTCAKEYTLNIPDLKYEQKHSEKEVHLKLNIFENLKYWDVDHPFLYNFTISTDDDCIKSYFAIRYLEQKAVNGYKRLFLNGKPLFIHGLLDQGYFIDGIFLPKKVGGFKQDILNMKELGFNLLRKHIKIEPDIFYYYCDKLGMLVMQDMVNSGPYSLFFDTYLPTAKIMWKLPRPFDSKRYDFFIKHAKETIEHLYNHPSLIAYTIYNEGWGQQKADAAYKTLKPLDPNRLFDATSGWFARKESDFESLHIYFRNEVAKAKKNKPLLISECGGYKRLIENHVFKANADYGYGTTNSEEELTTKIEEMYDEMVIPSIKYGCCGCIYTQVSDVEEEINGLYTYDRQICKVNKKRLKEISDKVLDAYKKACD